MAQAAQPSKLSPEEYLVFERASETKHEYADGEIFAMSGGTLAHSLLATNIARELGLALRGRGCRVLNSDMRIKISSTGRYVYPDVSMLCEQPLYEDETRDTLLNPSLIVEVLSDSSEKYDRGDKFTQYRSIASLEDYILVSQHTVLIEHFRRQADGSWRYRALGPGDRLSVTQHGCEISVDEVYLQVFDAPEASESS